jgi:hypothetical protein
MLTMLTANQLLLDLLPIKRKDNWVGVFAALYCEAMQGPCSLAPLPDI